MQEDQQEQRALVATPAPFSIRALVQMDEDTPLELLPHNCPVDTPEGRALLFRMAGKPEVQITPQTPYRLVVRHFLIRPDLVPGEEDGELVPVLRTTLSDGKDREMSSTSMVLAKRFKQLWMLCTEEERVNGVPVEIFSRQSKFPGRWYHDIRPLGKGEKIEPKK